VGLGVDATPRCSGSPTPVGTGAKKNGKSLPGAILKSLLRRSGRASVPRVTVDAAGLLLALCQSAKQSIMRVL